jgi:hypothetical protein
MTKMGRKYEITHTQTFSRKFDTRCNGQVSWLASCCLPSHSESSKQWFVDNNKLISLQLRVQLKNFNLDYDLKYKFVIPKFSLDSLLMLF